MDDNTDYVARAKALRAEGRLEEAEDAALSATQKAPKDANAWWQLALVYKALHDDGSMQPALERLVELAPGFVDGWYNYGALLARTQDKENAVRALEVALLSNDSHAPSLELLAKLLGASDDEQEQSRAIQALEKLQDLDSLSENETFTLAYLHGKQGNTLASASVYEKLLSTTPGPNAYLNLGIMYRSLLRYADAHDAWTRSLALRPDHEGTQKQMASLTAVRDAVRKRVRERKTPLLPDEDWYRHYVNPFHLLNVDPIDVEDNPKALQKARQALLREVELEENRVSWLPGLHIDRSSVLSLCETLNDAETWGAHYWVHGDKALTDFLTKGGLDYFVVDNRNDAPNDIAALLPRWPVISEAFAKQFSDALTKAIEASDFAALEALLSGRRLVLPEHQSMCFEAPLRAAKRMAEQLHVMREAAEDKPVDVAEVTKFMNTSAFGRVLPFLSVDFHDVHQSVCANLRGLSIAHYNRSQNSQEALAILQLCATSASRSAALKHQFEEDKRQLNEFIAHAKRHDLNLEFGNLDLRITANGVRYGPDWIAAADVQGIRWGMTAISQRPDVWRFVVGFDGPASTEIAIVWTVTEKTMEEQKKFLGKIVESSMHYLADHALAHLERTLQRPSGLTMANARMDATGVTFTVKGFFWNSEHRCTWSRVRSDIQNGHLVLQANDNPKAVAAIALETHYNAFLLKMFIDKKG